VRDVQGTQSVVCVVGGSRLQVHDSDFSWNQARPLAILNQASLLLNASTIGSSFVDAAPGGGYLPVMMHMLPSRATAV
jgi:hypothetical protein